MNLRIPGPIPCPEYVLEAVGGPMINHRGPEFRDLIKRTTEKLKTAFDTKNDVLILTCSGTGVMEAAIVNTLSPGDQVLGVSIGSFGRRFANIAETYGAQVTRLEFPLGSAADLEEIRKALRKNPAIKAVLVTHNETSTGVTNNLEAIAGVVKGEFDKLLIVDAVSSLGAIPLPVDRWRCDVVATASQKGWMTPPGLAMVSVSPRAWEACSQAKMPRFYLDFQKAKSYLSRGETPWTPALSILYGLDVALDRMMAQGMEAVFQKHHHIGKLTRDGVKGLGLKLFADERVASDTVTAVNVPEGVDGRKLNQMLREERQIVIAGGQESLDGKIFRIGHLGFVEERDIADVMGGLRYALPKLGFASAAKVRG